MNRRMPSNIFKMQQKNPLPLGLLTELLDSAVGTPRQLQRHVHSTSLIASPLVRLEGNPRTRSFADNRNVFLPIHESLRGWDNEQ